MINSLTATSTPLITADRAIALASAVVAGAALFVAVWQGILMRRHNRISVRPNLRFDLPLDAGPLRFVMRNTAFGPARIEEVTLAVDGQAIDGPLTDALRNAFIRIGLHGLVIHGNLLYKGSSIAAGEDYVFFTLVNTRDGDALRELAARGISRLTVEVRYRSIYGEEFSNRAVFAYVLS